MNPDFIYIIIFQAAMSVAGAFLAANLAMKKFRGEKWWEKKAIAYTELIEALHTMQWTITCEYERENSEEEGKRMWEEFRLAQRNVLRIANNSGFYISDEVIKAVREMEQECGNARKIQDRLESLIEFEGGICNCLHRIKEIGKADLDIKDS